MIRRSILLSLAALALAPTLAHAHFRLVVPPPVTASPQNLYVEDSDGLPQLSAPCGQADPGDTAVPTNVVTTLTEGSLVTISFDETIFHPGHYRVAIAQDQASLPADPPVTAGDQACGTTVIEDPPVLPVLADDVADHTAAFTSTQTVMIPLPAGMTCTNCILQITEFMSEHGLNNPGGCFYHHCMAVNITATGPQDAGVSVADASSTAPDGGNAATGGATSGGCDVDGTSTLAGASLIFLASLLILRRRR